MADEIDRAAPAVEAHVAEALKRRPLPPGGEPSDGVCRGCREAIEPERLTANPFARHCRDCAEEAEDERKRARRIGA